MMNWARTTSQAQLAENILRLSQSLNADVHEASRFVQVEKNVLVLARGRDRIRYSVENTKQGLQIVREVRMEDSKWRREPGYPVADFQTDRQGEVPVVQWQKSAAHCIDVEVSQPGFRFQTTITTRSAL
jgi:hypothetical protein